MLILGIETTCDETAISIVDNGHKILSNIIFSQASIHEKYQGVFPEIASRFHSQKLLFVLKDALKEANITLSDIDLIAVASGPGLLGSLLIGVNFAKALAFSLNKPIIAINHIEAHLFAAMMNEKKHLFPALGVVLSGGHTQFLIIENIGSYKILGSTIDDAIGECFDKVARVLGLPYPGGPHIEKISMNGDPNKYVFKFAEIKSNKYNTSFSGLKTSLLYTVKGKNAKEPRTIDDKEKSNIAASFQKVAFEGILKKCYLAIQEYNLNAIYFGGGVTNNQTLRKMAQNFSFNVPLFFPSINLSLDNGAMIAGLAYYKYLYKKESEGLFFEAESRMSLA